MANGLVTIVLSLLMSVVQVGPGVAERHRGDVLTVLEAAVRPVG